MLPPRSLRPIAFGFSLAFLTPTLAASPEGDIVSSSSSDYGSSDNPTPYQSFYSAPDAHPPELLLLTEPSSNGTLSPGYVFIAVDGDDDVADELQVPVIYDMSYGDNMGSPAWVGEEWNRVFDRKVREYKGEKVITFWNGTDQDGFGAGSYYILDEAYEVVGHIQLVGFEEGGDLHEFTITTNDTALKIIYTPTSFDLSSLNGSSSGYLMDCLFQEIDIATNTLLFQWNASSYVNPTETYATIGDASTTGTESAPLDSVHMNAVSKDTNGDYLVSMRLLHAVFKIDGSTGDVLWRLNGKNSDFEVEEDAQFVLQHDAKWVDGYEGELMTLCDNRDNNEPSRGLLLSIDSLALTCTLIRAVENGLQTFATFDGSYAVIDPANVNSSNSFMGFGYQPYFTEFDGDGNILLDVQFAVDKQEWVGRPKTLPSEVWDTANSTVYVSWNGATEVESWMLLKSGDSSTFSALGNQTRVGFETAVDVGDFDVKDYVKVAALAGNGTVLAYSEAVDGSGFSEAQVEMQDVGEVSATAVGRALASATTATSEATDMVTGQAAGVRVEVWMAVVGVCVWVILMN